MTTQVCTYCRVEYPAPVEYTHTDTQCADNVLMRAQIADEIEAFRRSMPEVVRSAIDGYRDTNDMSWVLAQARDRVKTGDWSEPSW